MKRATKPGSKLQREQVEQIIQAAHDQGVRPDLRGANLYGVNLEGIDFGAADLTQADLGRANLRGTNFCQALLNKIDLFEVDLRDAYLEAADLPLANLHGANLREARVAKANLQQANLFEANLNQTDLRQVNLEDADLSGAYLNWADFSQANLKGAKFTQASLKGTNFSQADLDSADFSRAILIETNFTEANLNYCSFYGVSAWNLNLEGAVQLNLVVSPPNEPIITIDDLEVAQFVELLLYSQKIHKAVDVVGKRIALIVGNFVDDRQDILNGLRDGLRAHDYLPLFFNAEQPDQPDLTETLLRLTCLARFIIVDLSEAPNLSQQLEPLIPALLSVPIQPLLDRSVRDDSVIPIYQERFPWILDVYRYGSLDDLLSNFRDKIFAPAEQKAKNLDARRQVAIEIEAGKKD